MQTLDAGDVVRVERLSHFPTDLLLLHASTPSEVILFLERLRENLADFNNKHFQNLYHNRLDGLITGHVLAQILEF